MATSTVQAPLAAHKARFLDACLSAEVLTFGEFTLKSGRKSPYFINIGSFHTGALLSALATAYAHTIVEFLASHTEIPKPDVIFGPAYKGIPLASCTLLELHRLDPAFWSSTSYSFNRKEAKSHGEGGIIVGASLKGKNVLVIDDVTTAGTAIRETIDLMAREGATVVAFVVAVDRQETMGGPGGEGGVGEKDSRKSAMGQVRAEYGIPAVSIVSLSDLILLMNERGEHEKARSMEEYRQRHGAND